MIHASLLLAAALGGADTQVFALVVAHNRAIDASTAPLKYADDDGARVYEMLSALDGAEVELLAELDQETQRTFVGLAELSLPPTMANIRTGMDRLVRRMTAAKSSGARTQFYFYFAGHGDVGEDREGFLNLIDGKLRRSDIYREVIARSTADVNHIIIDACNSYFVINRGGEAGETARDAIASFLQSESLAQYGNTGVVLSTATEQESHEWSRYRSGIFSHQFLSALWGAGDVNGDGRVQYDELAAYVAAANIRVSDPRARLSIFARAPRANAEASLIDLEQVSRHGSGTRTGVSAFMTVPRRMSGHYYLEDDRGVRYAEFHKSPEQPLRVALLDRPYYYLRSSDSEARLEPRGDVDASHLEFHEADMGSRGAVEQSFRRDLYAYPFGLSFWAGHREAQRVDPPEVVRIERVVETVEMNDLSPWAWGSAITSAVFVGTGVALQVVVAGATAELDSSNGLQQDQAVAKQRELLLAQTGAGIAFGIGGAAALTSVILFLLDTNEAVEVTASAHKDGAAASVTVRF